MLALNKRGFQCKKKKVNLLCCREINHQHYGCYTIFLPRSCQLCKKINVLTWNPSIHFLFYHLSVFLLLKYVPSISLYVTEVFDILPTLGIACNELWTCLCLDTTSQWHGRSQINLDLFSVSRCMIRKALTLFQLNSF